MRFTRILMAAACAALALAPLAATAATVKAVQFYHAEFQHYFLAVAPAEVADLDAGVHAGWQRTGIAYRIEMAPTPGLVPVCRFFTTLGGKASHFFTASAEECALVKTNPDWTYEGIAFHTALPDGRGACAAGTVAIHRLYNDGRTGSPNHMYTPYAAQRDRFQAVGWIVEGVAFCFPGTVEQSAAKVQALANSMWDFPSSAEITGQTAPARRAFGPMRTNAAVNDVFAFYGAPPLPYTTPVTDPVTGIGNGEGGWDGAASHYVMVFKTGLESDPPYVGTAQVFEDATSVSVPVCTATLRRNVDTRYPKGSHPFQPVLWSPCQEGIATQR